MVIGAEPVREHVDPHTMRRAGPPLIVRALFDGGSSASTCKIAVGAISLKVGDAQ
jgi:hypothetical protein